MFSLIVLKFPGVVGMGRGEHWREVWVGVCFKPSSYLSKKPFSSLPFFKIKKTHFMTLFKYGVKNTLVQFEFDVYFSIH